MFERNMKYDWCFWDILIGVGKGDIKFGWKG